MHKEIKVIDVLMIPSCKNPKRTLLRLKLGLQEWKKGQHRVLVLSGQRKDRPTKDKDMLQWILEQDRTLDKTFIVYEDKSRNTYENVHYTLMALFDGGFKCKSVTVVTQWQHGFRF